MLGIQAARQKFPEIADQISLSLHCETAEIMTAYTQLVEEEGVLTGLPAYNASRPPHSEGLAVTIASYLAHETELPTINLLHLTSRKAVEAALLMADTFPHIDFRREVTVGHLLADCDTAHGVGGKVNPPLRPREDVEALWAYLIDGKIDWVVSDHACCKEELKFGEPKDDVFLAKSGFGGAEYLLAGMVSEGSRRGVGVDAGVHPVRGCRAHRPRHGHVRPRPPGDDRRRGRWRPGRSLPEPPDRLSGPPYDAPPSGCPPPGRRRVFQPPRRGSRVRCRSC